MRRIYISGKITGLPISEAKENFKKVETYYRAKGVKVINPMSDKFFWNKYQKLPYMVYMAIDVVLILLCNEIHLQANWTDSRGAKIEFRIARFLGYKIN